MTEGGRQLSSFELFLLWEKQAAAEIERRTRMERLCTHARTDSHVRYTVRPLPGRYI
jgi:hypothetical protein